MKRLEFNRYPKQALSVRDVNKPRTSRQHYRSVALHTSQAHIHHQLVSHPLKEK